MCWLVRKTKQRKVIEQLFEGSGKKGFATLEHATYLFFRRMSLQDVPVIMFSPWLTKKHCN